jgi:hypothetical protein
MDTLRMTWPDPPPSEPPPPEKFPYPPAADTVVEKATVPSNADRLDIPPGHLPAEGECRIWIADTPPGRQARARTCNGAVNTAPAEAMVLEGLPDAKRHVRVFYIGAHTGTVARVAVFEKQTGKFVRTEAYTPSRATDRVTPAQPVSTDPPVDEPNPRRQNPTGAERYTEPPPEPAAKEPPPQQPKTDPPGRQSDAAPPEPAAKEPPPQQPKTDPPGRQSDAEPPVKEPPPQQANPNRPRAEPPPPAQTPPEPPPVTPQADAPVPDDVPDLDVAQGQLPDPGECRIWIPGTSPGRQAKAGSCDGIVSEAPAGSMVLEGMTDAQHVRVSYIGSSAGTVSRVVIFERRTGDFAREELP